MGKWFIRGKEAEGFVECESLQDAFTEFVKSEPLDSLGMVLIGYTEYFPAGVIPPGAIPIRTNIPLARTAVQQEFPGICPDCRSYATLMNAFVDGDGDGKFWEYESWHCFNCDFEYNTKTPITNNKGGVMKLIRKIMKRIADLINGANMHLWWGDGGNQKWEDD